MKAKVVKAFSGTPDGDAYPKDWKLGDPVAGDLGRVAVENGWAEEVSEDEFAALVSAAETPAEAAEEAAETGRAKKK